MKKSWFVLLALAAASFAAPVLADGNDDNNLCYAQFRGGNDKAAIDYCTKAINSGDLAEPDLVGALINRGVAYHHVGDSKRAVVDYTLALKHAPRDSLIYANRANARLDLGELDKALADANTAIKLDPKRGANFYVRGSIEQAKNHFNRARADYIKALSIEPDNKGYRRKLLDLDTTIAKGG